MSSSSRTWSSLCLVLAILFGSSHPADAQYRSGARTAAGVALVATGVVVTLSARTCTPPPLADSYIGFRNAPDTPNISIRSASGGPWLWSDCTFGADFLFPDGSERRFFERHFRDPDDPATASFWADLADDAIAKVTGTSSVRRWAGVGLIGVGALLATVWSDTYAEPMFDVQAGPRHVRLSKTFGF